MVRLRARRRWVGAISALGSIVFLGACASIPFDQTAARTTAPAVVQPDDDDWSQLDAQMRSDLNRFNSREVVRSPAVAPTTTTTRARDQEFANRARALFAPLSLLTLRMPVVGVRATDLSDNWHDPRDGGARLHKGIDIFARRGTAVVAVADGVVTYIGRQPKGGNCLWLTSENGAAFFYAHLDRWAPGLYEGIEVQAGDLLGFVGNTGNARHTPSHLHFAVSRNDTNVDPYPLLTHALFTRQARLHVVLGGGFGTK